MPIDAVRNMPIDEFSWYLAFIKRRNEIEEKRAKEAEQKRRRVRR